MTFFTLLRTSGTALLAGTLLFTTIGCSEPLSTREQGALLEHRTV